MAPGTAYFDAIYRSPLLYRHWPQSPQVDTLTITKLRHPRHAAALHVLTKHPTTFSCIQASPVHYIFAGMEQQQPATGSLSWKLSAHPITLLTFLIFRAGTSSLRIALELLSPPFRYPFSDMRGDSYEYGKLTNNLASLVVYLLGLLFTDNMFVTTKSHPFPSSHTPDRPTNHPIPLTGS